MSIRRTKRMPGSKLRNVGPHRLSQIVPRTFLRDVFRKVKERQFQIAQQSIAELRVCLVRR
jgi:hypothetical protein